MTNSSAGDSLDLELWLAYRDGDSAAFTALYRRHAGAVLRYAWSIVREQAAAEEVLQDTFLTVWDRRRASRTVDESLLPWILVICRNYSRNAVRRITKHRAVSLDSVPEVPAVNRPELEWIADELAKFSATDRQLCHLCLVEGYTYAEAARILDTTHTAVGKRLQRIRARLAEAATVNE
jgi:RNA polymerase sigma factor (sigma-70 family)